mmetsp:Transcript_63828/g.134431  ORF Transcript_63828/g.134431 Transcript_63828/m.134431 type:complete len:203 (+) Transcript_63828:780-1388(+)
MTGPASKRETADAVTPPGNPGPGDWFGLPHQKHNDAAKCVAAKNFLSTSQRDRSSFPTQASKRMFQFSPSLMHSERPANKSGQGADTSSSDFIIEVGDPAGGPPPLRCHHLAPSLPVGSRANLKKSGWTNGRRCSGKRARKADKLTVASGTSSPTSKVSRKTFTSSLLKINPPLPREFPEAADCPILPYRQPRFYKVYMQKV